MANMMKLQFGHGCGAVEMHGAGSVTLAAALTLQFGHGCGAVEMPDSLAVRQADTRSFNSATAAEPWRYCLFPGSPIRYHRFNSATAAEPWR